eukprot:scaffold1384_cov116-Cylindrotheca_fusiformis.AAC.6
MPSPWYVLLYLALIKFSNGTPDPGACDASTTSLKNAAFVFVKPHANTLATRKLVSEKLLEAGLDIISEVDIDGEEIDEKSLIDNHYFSIASKATILPPEKIPVPENKFEEFFGESYQKALREKRAFNAQQACERFQCTPMELNEAWRKAEQESKVVKFGGGFYCGQLSVNGKPELYVFNAFFMSMRSKFVGNGKSIHCYEVEWDPAILTWASFRESVLGPTDPSQAEKGSIRRTILDNYEKLGLSSKPNKSDNGVHASASPFEGLAEKANWLGLDPKDDYFGKSLLGAGINKERLTEWFKDPQVKISDSAWGSLFDALENMDVEACFQELAKLNALNQ